MLAPALLLAAALSLADSASGAAPTPDTPAIEPRRQALDLVVDPAQSRWTGSLRVWATVRSPMRRFALLLRGPTVSRVAMNQPGGNVSLAFGAPRDGALWIEADHGLVPGAAGLDVGLVGAFADSGGGFVRRGPQWVALARGAGASLPAWPDPAVATPWTIDVHVPAGCVVRSNLPRTEITRQQAWRTWSFATSRRLPADSLRIEVLRPRRRDR